MFGSTSFGSSPFGQQNNNQQSGGAFGQPAAGTTPFGQQSSAFGGGNTSTFGQPQQQQQPQQQTSGFGGGFGSTPAPSFGGGGTSTAGAFGGGSTGGAFGASTPAPSASGSGAFGSFSTGGSSFGQSTPAPATSTLFGRPSTTPSAFGGGTTSSFGTGGQTSTASPFGQTGSSSAFGQTSQPAPGIPTNGTPAPFQAFTEKAPGDSFTSVYQSISCMAQYRNASFEELRIQDYLQNRKTPTPANNSAFGSTNSTFGQQNPPTTSAFGKPPGQSTFGNAGGGFGSGPFGQQSNTSTPGFGATPASTPGAFGTTPASTSSFGSTPAPAATSSFFGGNNQQQQQQPGGAFGTPASGGLSSTFGANSFKSTTTPGAFGTTPAPNNQQQQQQPKSFSSFGFGSTLGQGQQQQQQPGQGAFGQPASGSSIFGSTQQNQQGQQQQQPPSTSLFGQSANPSGSGGFGFGAQNNQPKPAGFGTTPSTFGTSAPPAGENKPGFGFGVGSGASNNFGLGQQPGLASSQPPTSGFGAPASNFGAFGVGNNNASSIFAPKPAGAGTGLGQPAQPGSSFGSLFSQPSNQQQTSAPGLAGGMFSSFAHPPQPNPQTFIASVDQNPYGTNPIFANVPPPPSGPQASVLDNSQKKKPPMSTSFRSSPKTSSKIVRLRGFTPSTSSLDLEGGASSLSPKLSGSPLHFLNGAGDESNLSPTAFVSRQNVKRLVIDRCLSKEDIYGRSRASTEPLPDGQLGRQEPSRPTPRVTFDPTLERAAHSPLVGLGGDRRNGTAIESKAANGSFVPSEDPNETTILSDEDTGALNSDEYYTKPPFATILRMSQAELESFPDLEVGRVGHGKVKFRQPVDLKSLHNLKDLLGTTVRFEDKSIIVYPSDEGQDKPEVGTGLNVPATVTLEKCWPLDKATREPVRDPDDPRLAKHVKRLKKMGNTKYIDFVPETGAWTFGVAHFSRYGFDPDATDEDSDDSSDDDSSAGLSDDDSSSSSPSIQGEDLDASDALPPRRFLLDDTNVTADYDEEVNRAEPIPLHPRTRRRDHSTFSEDSGIEIDADVPQSKPPQISSMSRPDLTRLEGRQPWPQTLGLEPKKIAVMQASFFHQPETTERPSSPPSRREPKSFPGQRLLTNRPLTNPIPPPSLPKRPQEFRPPRKQLPSPGQPSQLLSTGSKANLATDASAMFRGSFRVGWTADGRLIRPSFTQEGGAALINVRIDTVPITERSKDAESMIARSTLKTQLSRTQIVTEEGVPRAVTDPSLRFLHFTERGSRQNDSHEAAIFRLGHALFDELDEPCLPPTLTRSRVTERVVKLRRKDLLTRWLTDQVAPIVESELRSTTDPAAKIFTLLSGNQVARAADMAAKSGRHRLATLLAQVGGDEEFRKDVYLQLRRWRESRADAQVPPLVKKIYDLLSGEVLLSEGTRVADGVDSVPTILLTEGLDWMRAFGLFLWYQNFESSVQHSLSQYQYAAEQHPHWVAEPLPRYRAAGEPTTFEPSRWEADDGAVELLRLFSNPNYPLDRVLAPRSYGPSPIDVRLPWHLSAILSQSPLTTSTVGPKDSMTLSYAAQLEALGSWPWSIFVLLHLSRPECRETAIQQVLARHVFDLPQHMEFLLETLKIPLPTLAIVQANALKTDSPKSALSHYLKASHTSAQEQAVNLAYEYILRSQTSSIPSLFSGFRPGVLKDAWTEGGSLFLQFAQLVAESHKLPDETVQQLISSLSSRVSVLARTTATNDWIRKVALDDMLSAISSIAIAYHQTLPITSRLPDIQSERANILASSAFQNWVDSVA